MILGLSIKIEWRLGVDSIQENRVWVCQSGE